MNLADYLETALANWLFRNTDMPGAPNSLWFALHNGHPGDAGGANECAASNGYARVEATTGTAGSGSGSVFNAPSDGAVDNASAITFASPTGGGWGYVAFGSIKDASTSGNTLMWFPLGANTTLSAGIDGSQTTLTVPTAAGFPSSGAYYITIDTEHLEVTAGQGTTTWTVTRGIGGSTPATHSSGAIVAQARLIQGGDSAPSFAAGAFDASFS